MHDLSHAQWRKASHSNVTGDNCVEVARLPEQVAVRDSQDPEGNPLIFTVGQWKRLTRELRGRGV